MNGLVFSEGLQRPRSFDFNFNQGDNDMLNTVNSGDTIEYTNSGSAIASGAAVVFGNRIGIAEAAIAATSGTGALKMKGRYTLTKLTADDVHAGDSLFWDNGNSRLTLTGTGNTFAGYAAAAAGTSATTVDVILAPPGPKQLPLQAASTASTTGGIVADFNTFLVLLQTNGWMKNA